jgi:Lon protease-like protein
MAYDFLMDNKIFLFPLQNSVLFKKVTLPYHIFEERYREMVRDACDQEIPVGIVTYHQSNIYSGEICVAGIPHILSTYPDGRMDIYITGMMKCRLMDFQSENPYKVYTYRPLEEEGLKDDSYEMELWSLRAFLERWSCHFLPDPLQRDKFLSTLEEPEILINYCAVFLVDDMAAKTEIMKASSIKEKIKVLMHVMGPKEIPLGPFMPSLKL